MNYDLIYKKLIERAKTRNLEGYVEKHHIIPRCLGGSDAEENLVCLSAREHFIAHLLLAKMNPGSTKLIKAVVMMTIGQSERKMNNRLYEWTRKRFSEAQSISQSGVNNSQHNTRWINNKALKISKKIKKSDILPDGWDEGRIVNFDKPVVPSKSQQKRDNLTKIYTEWYEAYNKFGFEKFKQITGYDKSKPALVNQFKRYVKSFVPQNGKKRGI